MPALTFANNNKDFLITGKSFYIKDVLKGLNGTWDPTKRCWVLPLEADTPYIRKNLNQKAQDAIKLERATKASEEANKKTYLASPEGKEDQWNEILARKSSSNPEVRLAYSFICCKECVIIDWKRQHTTCEAHKVWNGQSWNSFRVRGNIYTSD